MQIIVVYFLYHVRPKKAIAQVVLKIKSADRTKGVSVSLFFYHNWLTFLLTKHL